MTLVQQNSKENHTTLKRPHPLYSAPQLPHSILKHANDNWTITDNY